VFRPGSSRDSTALKPVAAQSTELGWRGQFAGQIAIDLAYYQLRIKDDVVSFIDGNDRKVTNAGKTNHDGVEAAIRVQLTPELNLNSGWTWTKQQYDDFSYVFSCFPPACSRPITETRNYSGFDVGKAPKQLGQISLQYNPSWMQAVELEMQWQKIGRYFTDETNTASYAGHHLIDLRLNYQISGQWRLYGRLMNLQDRTYSSYTSNQVGNPQLEYRPGMPRTLILGSQYQF
jgi:outer membrane receptor protein involved in Fe transport